MTTYRACIPWAVLLSLYACSSESLQGGGADNEPPGATSEPEPAITPSATSPSTEGSAPNASATSGGEPEPVGSIAPPAMPTASGTSDPAEPTPTG